MLFTVLILLSAQSRFSEAQALGNKLTDTESACQLAGGAIRALCITLQHQGKGPELLGFDEEGMEVSSTLAVGVVADVLTEAVASVNEAVEAVLPRVGNSYRYCEALREELKGTDATPAETLVACLRPICLTNKGFGSVAANCAPLSQSGSGQLAKRVSDFLQSGKGIPYGCPPAEDSQQATVGHFCVGEQAAELVVKVDQLLQFADAIRKRAVFSLKKCGSKTSPGDCEIELTEMLRDLGASWALGSVLSEALRRQPELATALDPGLEFSRAWDKVEAAEPTRDTIVEPGRAHFPFELQFAEALRGSREPIAGVLNHLRARLREQVLEAFSRGAAIGKLLGAVTTAQAKSVGLTDSCKQAVIGLASVSAPSGTEEAVFVSAKTLASSAHCLDPAEAAVLTLQAANAPVTPVADACADSVGARNLSQGFVDLCFKHRPSKVGPLGLRFSFRPCAQLKKVGCATVGDLELLIRTRPFPESTVIAYSLGLSDISARVSDDGIEVIPIPPRPAYSSPDMGRLTDAMRRMLPPAFTIVRVETVTLSPHLEVRIEGINLAVAGIEVGDVCASITTEDISFAPGGECQDPKHTADSLLGAARAVLDRTLSARASALSLTGLPIPLQQVRLLKGQSDGCPEGHPIDAFAGAQTPDLVALCGSTALALSGSTQIPLSILWQIASGTTGPKWQLFADEAKVREALKSILPSDANIEAIATGDHSIEAQVTVSKGCRVALRLDATDKDGRQTLERAAHSLTECALTALAVPAMPDFQFFGLTFSVSSGSACTAQIEGGPVCLRNFRLSNGAPDLSAATLDDQGRLGNQIKRRIQALLPGSQVEIDQVLPHPKGRVQLPMLDSVPIDLSGDVARSLESAAAAALRDGLNKVVVGHSVSVGAFSVEVLSAVDDPDLHKLILNVNLRYGAENIQTRLHILPSFELERPSVAVAFVNAIKKLVGGIDIPGAKADVVMGADGVPVVLCAITVPLGISALSASGTIEWRPGQGSSPQPTGPITIKYASYTTIFAGVDIGEITGQIPLFGAGNISLSATLALTNGDVTQDALRLTGSVTFDKVANTLTVDTGLFVAGMRLAKSTGVADFRQQSVEVKLAPEGPAAYLPLPAGQAGIYGTACLASGKVSMRLFNSFDLVDAVSVIMLPDSCAADLSLRDRKLAALNSAQCSNPGTDGLLCVAGNVDVVSLFQARSVIRTPLGAFSPILGVHGSTSFADLDVNASLRRIKVSADVKFLRVTVIFPSATGIDADLLRRLLENLLHPSIDLESLLSGNIVVSAERGNSRGESESTTGPPGSNEKNGKTGEERAKEKIGAPAAPVLAAARNKVNAQRGTRLAYSEAGDVIEVMDDGRVMHGNVPYRVSRLDRQGTLGDQRFTVRVHPSRVKELMDGGANGLVLIPYASAFELDDGWYVPMCRGQCGGDKLVAVMVSLNEKSAGDHLLAIPNITGFPEFNSDSYNVVHASLPHLIQRVLTAGPITAEPEIWCGGLIPKSCSVAIYRLKSDSEWSYFGPYRSIPIRKGSFWYDALTTDDPLALIDSTQLSQVLAMSRVNGDGRESAILSRTYNRLLSATVLRNVSAKELTAQQRTLLEIKGAGGLVTLDTRAQKISGGALASLKSSQDGWEPWAAGPRDEPLSLVLEALPPNLASKDLAVIVGPNGHRVVAYPAKEGDANTPWVFSMRDEERACKAIKHTRKELLDQLAVWAEPPSMADPKTGRLRNGTKPELALKSLAEELTHRSSEGSVFLIDPMFLFYASGACP